VRMAFCYYLQLSMHAKKQCEPFARELYRTGEGLFLVKRALLMNCMIRVK
jgi:hypothetical protein